MVARRGEGPEAEASAVNGADFWEAWDAAGRPAIDARTAACPACQAPAGEPCRTKVGRLTHDHSLRVDAALRLLIPDAQLSFAEVWAAA